MSRVRSGLGRRIRQARRLGDWWVGPNRASRRRLAELRDRHRGERCFVFGNGPSLNRTDLPALRDEVTFGLNRIYLKFDAIGYETDYLVCINKHVLRQFSRELQALDCIRFLSAACLDLFELTPRVLAIPTAHAVGFARNPIVRGVHEGGTVTFAAIQLAYFMGFSEVVLVGVDHRFHTAGPANQLVTAAADDPDHFDPTYFGPGVRWQLPDLEASERAFGIAKRVFEADGRRIIDATVDGDLQVFPKAELAEVLRR
jgi:hypothetical protein